MSDDKNETGYHAELAPDIIAELKKCVAVAVNRAVMDAERASDKRLDNAVAAAVHRAVMESESAPDKRLDNAVDATVRAERKQCEMLVRAENETCAVQVERMLEGMSKFCADTDFIEDLKSIPMAIRDRVAAKRERR